MTSTAPAPLVSLSLSRYGERGWEWTETTEHGTYTFHTDARGEGLWVWQRTSGWCVDRFGDILDHSDPSSCGMCWEWKQILGHTQYRLPADRRAAYAHLRRDALARFAW